MNQTIAFLKGTPETLITEALESLPLLRRLLSTNRPILGLDVIDNLLDLEQKLGNQVFSRLLKSQYSLTAQEISQKLGMAELKPNLDRTGLLNRPKLDALLQIRTEGCAALAKVSEELAATLINQISDVAGLTISTIRALVRRETKGFNSLPTSEEIAIYQPTNLVTITKTGKIKNRVAEVLETPDTLRLVQVKQVKTNRKRTLFCWKIKLHQLTTPEIKVPIRNLTSPQIVRIICSYLRLFNLNLC